MTTPEIKPDENEISKQIGVHIRRLRAQRNISLSQLAHRSGVAKGTLSKLEAGEGNPTILTLGALARVLRVTPGDFIAPRVTTTTASAGPELQGPGIQMSFIHHISGLTTWNIYSCYVPFLPEPLISPTHRGTEHLLILEGAIKVGPTDSPVELKTGDHFVLDGSEPHMYFPIGGPCRMLLMMAYPQSSDEAPR